MQSVVSRVSFIIKFTPPLCIPPLERAITGDVYPSIREGHYRGWVRAVMRFQK